MSNLKEFFRGVKKGQKMFGECIATIINSVLLSIVYFIGFGVTSFLGKLKGTHFLQLSVDKKAKSYWNDLNLSTQSKEEYLRQF